MSSLLVEHSSLGQLAALSPRQRLGSISNRTSGAAVRYGATHATQHLTAGTKDFLVLHVLGFPFQVLMLGVVFACGETVLSFLA